MTTNRRHWMTLGRTAVAASLLAGVTALPVQAQSYLIVVDSLTDRLVQLNGTTGAVVNPGLVTGLNGPVTTGNSTPKGVIDSGRDTLFVTDQLRDHVLEIGWDGTIIGPVAPWALDNVRGLARLGSSLLVTNGGTNNGAPGFAISQRNLVTGAISTWATGIDAFDLIVRSDDVLVSNIDLDRIDRYSHQGAFLGVFNQSNGGLGMNFPQQIAISPTGEVYVAVFSVPGSGLQRYRADGSFVQIYTDLPRIRGVGFLTNGEVVTTDGGTVWATVPDTGADRELLRGGSYQYVTRVDFHNVTGQVILGDWTGVVAGLPLTLEILDQGVVTGTKTVTLNAQGEFTWSTSRKGSHALRLKGGHWLSQSVSVTLGGPTSASWSLINGDVDGDNAVTVFDYDALSAAFDTESGDPAWNPNADLDGDGTVTVFDYDVLSANFDQTGT